MANPPTEPTIPALIAQLREDYDKLQTISGLIAELLANHNALAGAVNIGPIYATTEVSWRIQKHPSLTVEPAQKSSAYFVVHAWDEFYRALAMTSMFANPLGLDQASWDDWKVEAATRARLIRAYATDSSPSASPAAPAQPPDVETEST